MVIRSVKLPIPESQKGFCDYMGYTFIEKKGDFYIYDVPANHVCRFNLNFDRWKHGTFNKEQFLALLLGN